MPTLTLHEKQTVEYDRVLKFGAEFMHLKDVYGFNSTLRAGVYRHSGGVLTIPKGQIGRVVCTIEGNSNAGRYKEIYLKLLEEVKVPGALPAFNPRTGVPTMATMARTGV